MNQLPVARIIVIVALVLIGGGAVAYAVLGQKTAPAPTVAAVTTSAPAATNTSTTTTTVTTTTVSPTQTPTTSAASTSTYKDGTYSATGSYISPGGDEKIGVTVTLKNDIITSASVTPEPVSSEGKEMQGIFQANFQPLVVGKDISDVHLSVVSGSSLTSGGFNQALAEIEIEAKA